MIAKHISMNSVQKSDFCKLVNYITNPQQKSERVGLVSVTNCHGDRPDVAVLEVLNTQQINTRSAADKTYHLIVSFRAGEEPNQATLKGIEERLCEGLGFSEHQRLSVIHHDSDNVHLHIAINKIHPTRYIIHEPYRAYRTLGQLCEELEREYGLQPDNHQPRNSQADNRVQDMERHTGIESLLSWIKRECLGQLQHTQSWSELHQVLRDHGLEIRERANGLIITDSAGTMVKASSVSRDLSKAKLEARVGPFQLQPAPQLRATTPSRRYEPRPVRTRVDTCALYGQYKDEQDHCRLEGQAQRLAARQRKNHAIDAAKRSGRLKHAAIKMMSGGGIGKKALYKLAAKSLKDEIHTIVKEHSAERALIQNKYRREAWVDWLRRKAADGDHAALAALRAREATQGLKGNTVAGLGRRINGAVDATVDSITKKGTVIYRSGTAAIRDDGTRLAVSRGATQAGLEAALRMAMQRYGNRLTVTGSDEFKEQIARVTATTRLPVTFAEAALESRRRTLSALGVGAPVGAAGKRVDERDQNVVESLGVFDITKLLKRARSRGRGR